ncbi:Flp family type IVb pilin [Tranquillimonas alkanivorans]|uniref:Flp pilus assembly protein, pilin Flp n=1 Tax=Tranquillimonas alkanivorans TaxID=441119 RepID=A0A1I5M9I9_9RHOB|nr:pilus assembly protein [Tranquillimonas alkanivorans]SFP06205.1 hypothetical protein SAMN04488047_102165 [Tranquillimonas alkanivorans]
MKLFDLIKTFRNDEDGAVTVDWVVLTAAIVGLGIAVITAVSGGVNNLGDSINTSLSEATVDNLSDLATAADKPAGTE